MLFVVTLSILVGLSDMAPPAETGLCPSPTTESYTREYDAVRPPVTTSMPHNLQLPQWCSEPLRCDGILSTSPSSMCPSFDLSFDPLQDLFDILDVCPIYADQHAQPCICTAACRIASPPPEPAESAVPARALPTKPRGRQGRLAGPRGLGLLRGS